MAEFALAWPVVVLVTSVAIELCLWAALAAGARTAALSGARAGAIAGGSTSTATSVALASLRPVAFGVQPAAWCPGSPSMPLVWVCVHDLGTSVEVIVGGQAPGLVPVPVAAGLPVHADVTVNREQYT